MEAQNLPLQFSLIVDDFGIKYERQEDTTHILNALDIVYEIYKDWDGNYTVS